MITIANDIEAIGDIIHRNIVPLIDKKNSLEHDFSDEGKEELMIYHTKVYKQILKLQGVFEEKDLKEAQSIMMTGSHNLNIEAKYRLRHLERIKHDMKESIETHEVHIELLDILKNINVYSTHTAKTFLNSCS